ncbi:hypothetical protein Cni_G12877 [Canna indica]|uniref:CAAX prenyl protease 2/Lysostaphin resistance protein A-like domain-containing protein n=1 Tax=Canna indica TaxID=4628 RepID=A0AAQ3QC73_9LILI|nr:hypothetical protein Cni_G12877 [Canna indica]
MVGAVNILRIHGISCARGIQLLCSRENYRPVRKCGRSLFPQRKILPAGICSGLGLQLKAFASRKSKKKVKNDGSFSKASERKELLSKDFLSMPDGVSSGNKTNSSTSSELTANTLGANSSNSYPTRGQVLQACIITCGLLLAVGALIRQAVHLASVEGWALLDSSEVSLDFELWHLELILGLVVLISSTRYILLKTWPDFSQSSEIANQQILSSLEPFDYIVVSFLPGISEELLFRGALLPLFGLNWISALVVGAIFGVLHLGSGRKYSYAVWATFVGFAYGLATIISSSILVPMASHSLNNLVGGLLWRLTSDSREQDRGNLQSFFLFGNLFPLRTLTFSELGRGK